MPAPAMREAPSEADSLVWAALVVADPEAEVEAREEVTKVEREVDSATEVVAEETGEVAVVDAAVVLPAVSLTVELAAVLDWAPELLVKQASLDPALTVKGADWTVAPVWSRRAKLKTVP